MLHTADAAKSWQPLAGAIDPTLAIDTIDLAPSDPQRIYVTGQVFGAFHGTMLVSVDGGQSYASYEIPYVAGETGAYIAAVDPNDENRIYVRTLGLSDADTGEHVSRLLVSLDGGQTYTPHWSGDAMLGFALSQDGSRVYLGSIADGLFAADASSLSFAKVSSLEIQCLATHADALRLRERSERARANRRVVHPRRDDERRRELLARARVRDDPRADRLSRGVLRGDLRIAMARARRSTRHRRGRTGRRWRPTRARRPRDVAATHRAQRPMARSSRRSSGLFQDLEVGLLDSSVTRHKNAFAATPSTTRWS